jgi:hypothetical protein
MCRERHSRSVALPLWLQDGCTPLHDAATSGHDTVVEVLVRASADGNAVDEVRHLTIFASPRCTAAVDNV